MAEELLVAKKPAGTVLPVLDGHTSQYNSVVMPMRTISVLTVPSHTKHYLQTLHQAVFNSVKTFYFEACRMWLKGNPGRPSPPLQFG